MTNAEKISCDVLFGTTDAIYEESIRQFQGCPTIAVTKGGRVWCGWYAGGVREPHMDNYNLLFYSDDDMKTMKRVCVIPSSKERLIHAIDIQLWIDPRGRLWVFWVQNNVLPRTEENVRRTDLPRPLIPTFESFPRIDGFMFVDYWHSEWCMVCDDPDAETPVFSEPRYLDHGFTRCKPLALADGTWLMFNYDQLTTKYGYSISKDEGKTWTHRYGGEKCQTYFDEGMAYQMRDGAVRMLARSAGGKIAESISRDSGETFTDGTMTDIVHADTRLYVARTPSGRILLVRNDDPKRRTNLTVCLSEDDGKTWRYEKTIDHRNDLSYPDVDFSGGNIYLIYDRERIGAKEILFAKFTEDDLLDESKTIDVRVISKP